MKITFVKKIKADGSACAKCADVQKKLDDNNQMQFINRTIVADERDSSSEGMIIAQEHNVERAPFFVVEKDDGTLQMHTVYLKFVKEVLDQQTSEKDEAKDLLDSNPDLDFI